MLAVPWLQRTARAALAAPMRRSLIGVAAVVAAAAIAALLVTAPFSARAQIEVGGVAFTLPAQANRVLASISIKNDGSLPALIIGANNAFILTSKEMSREEEDSEWNHLGAATRAPQGAPQRLEAGAQWPHYAVVKTLERNEYAAFLSGSQLIYFLMRTVYRDESLPPSKRRITEACYYYAKDLQQPRACHGHNRRYVAD
jgi:hypothetical protein